MLHIAAMTAHQTDETLRHSETLNETERSRRRLVRFRGPRDNSKNTDVLAAIREASPSASGFTVPHTDREKNRRCGGRKQALDGATVSDQYQKPLSAKQRRIAARIAHSRNRRLGTINDARRDGIRFLKDGWHKMGQPDMSRRSKLDNSTLRVSQQTLSRLDRQPARNRQSGRVSDNTAREFPMDYKQRA